MTPGCILWKQMYVIWFALKMVIFASITEYKMLQNKSALRGFSATCQRSITVLWWCYVEKEGIQHIGSLPVWNT